MSISKDKTVRKVQDSNKVLAFDIIKANLDPNLTFAKELKIDTKWWSGTGNEIQVRFNGMREVNRALGLTYIEYHWEHTVNIFSRTIENRDLILREVLRILQHYRNPDKLKPLGYDYLVFQPVSQQDPFDPTQALFTAILRVTLIQKLDETSRKEKLAGGM